jgi:hypothetical protein
MHPSLSSEAILEKLDDLIDGSIPDLANESANVGEGPMIDLPALLARIGEINVALDARKGGTAYEDLDDDQFEGEMATLLYDALSTYPVEVLDDPGFWAYLAAGPLWFFVRWRENPSKRKREGYYDYLDGRVNHACVPLRMFLRAQAVHKDGDTSLAAAVERGVDFWRSHIIRVRTGAKRELAHAVAKEQTDDHMTRDPLREYAKRINRRWSNQVLYLLDEDESRELASSERDAS